MFAESGTKQYFEFNIKVSFFVIVKFSVLNLNRHLIISSTFLVFLFTDEFPDFRVVPGT